MGWECPSVRPDVHRGGLAAPQCSELMYSVILDYGQYWTISWTKLERVF